jgi:hypothetical protein
MASPPLPSRGDRFELPCLSVIRLDSLCQRKFAPCKIDHTLLSYLACIVRIVPFYCRFHWSSESLIRFIMSHHVRGVSEVRKSMKWPGEVEKYPGLGERLDPPWWMTNIFIP